MSLDDNKRVAREFFSRLSASDLDGALALMAGDATWWIAGKPGSVPVCGTLSKEQFGKLIRRMVGRTNGGLRVTIKGMTAEGDRLAVELASHGELTDGRVYDQEYHVLLEIREGTIRAAREYLDTQHVLATWFPPGTAEANAARPALGARGLLETAVYGPDLPALERFYVEVFGLEPVARTAGRNVVLRCGLGALILFDPGASSQPGGLFPAHGARGPGHIAFVVPEAEVEAWRAHLAAAGVAIESEVAWPEGGRSLYLRDPAGNSVELAPPTIWGGLGARLLDASRRGG
jgi:ketosteroid isomerase-like protein/catechol 2,3-dioxygenase-like lactoylglutathione lyase family enzyme